MEVVNGYAHILDIQEPNKLLVTLPVVRVVPTLISYLPPVLVVIIKAIIPVALKNVIVRLVNRSRAI